MELLLKILTAKEAEGFDMPGGFFEKVFPNIWAFLAQFIAFIILVLVGWKVLYKPVHEFIEKRKEYIKNNLEEAASKNEEASKYLEESKASIAKANKEAIGIIQEAKVESEKQRQVALEEQALELASKRAKAQEDIEHEHEKMLKELHDEVVDLAFEATKSILDREVDKEDNKKLVDSFVDELMEK